jgi:hypothetical protein
MSDPAVSAQAGTREAIVGNYAAAFEDFFRGQTQSLFAHLCLITGNRAEAEELAQDAFLKVWERWDRVADMEEPTGYLYRTAMNLFRKRYRRAVLALRKTVSEELRRDEFATVEDRVDRRTCAGRTRSTSAGGITTVSNLVSHGCRDHSWAVPPIGPSVEDLATSLANLAPFRVTSAPEDVSVHGYAGMHLEMTVPDLPVSDDGTFTGCDESNLKSWVAAIDAGELGDAFYGYTGPGYVEEFWILDVEGTRLMIAAGRSPGSPSEDIEEQRAIVDSIRIEP